jgi:bifunctional non-homologous end joining protein LigD
VGDDPITDLSPMLARPGELPRDEENWAFEVKWDGVRALVFCDGAELALRSRNGKDITPRYPELAPLAAALPPGETVLDGEVVALDEEGKPSFELLQGRMHLTRADEVSRRSRLAPVRLQLFDLLFANGESLLPLPYSDRRRRLEELALEGPAWTTPASRVGEGSELLAATAALGLEGLIAKRLTGTYRPGARSPDWIKVKNVMRQELVIGGWAPQKERGGELGALLVGFHEGGASDDLRYAGRVGTGWSRSVAADLLQRLGAVASPDSPFGGSAPRTTGAINFVEPVLVVEVEFTEVTREGMLRHPSFKGLRDDKPAAEVVWELPAPPAATKTG